MPVWRTSTLVSQTTLNAAIRTAPRGKGAPEHIFDGLP